jgi:hypothetical protein
MNSPIARPAVAARERVVGFGLEVTADFPLPGLEMMTGAEPAHRLVLRRVTADMLPAPGDEPRYLRNLQAYGGSGFVMLEGAAGDVLFQYGRRAIFHLSADHRLLRCATGTGNEALWQRVLLDTVLWTVSLLRGFELLHGSAVGTPGGTVALVAGMGGGKSSLAAEYLRRGASLFTDDVIALAGAEGAVVAHPGPPLMSLPRRLTGDRLRGAEVIADFGDEHWVRIARETPVPRPLAALVLIHRVPGARASCSRLDATSLTLLPHVVTLPHLTQRARHRFEMFGAVAASTPVLSLTADPSVATHDLADLIQGQIALL